MRYGPSLIATPFLFSLSISMNLGFTKTLSTSKRFVSHDGHYAKLCSFLLGMSVAYLVGVILAPPVWAANKKSEGRLIVEDVLARPGTPVMLRARLVQEGLLGLTALGGETVTFFVQGQLVGTALTGGDGWAFLEYKTHMRGNHKIVAEVEESPRVHPTKGEGNFASWERRKPILLVDVMTLLKKKDAGPISFPGMTLFTPLKWGDADEDAPTELTKLGEFYYNIIYLYRGNKSDIERIREWLKAAGFPPGITRVIDPGPGTLLEFIQQLKERGWDNIEAGVGRSQDFANTLVKNRIKTVIFPDRSKKEKFPRRAKIVSEWKEVRKHL